MKKFLFILLIAITTSIIVKPDNAVTDTDNEVKKEKVTKKTFNEFLLELPKKVKDAYTWLKNNELFDDVKTTLLTVTKKPITKAQKNCAQYGYKTNCEEFVKQYAQFLKEN